MPWCAPQVGTSPQTFLLVCPASLQDDLVTAPALEPALNADENILQAIAKAMTSKQMQYMKKYYNTSVKPQWFEEGDKVLHFHLKNKSGHYVKWQVATMIVKGRLNDTNYVLHKLAKGRPIIIHVNCMRHIAPVFE